MKSINVGVSVHVRRETEMEVVRKGDGGGDYYIVNIEGDEANIGLFLSPAGLASLRALIDTALNESSTDAAVLATH